MEPVRLVTFYDLLQQGYTVGQLATAVEKYGVTGWDRFGRYGDFAPPPKSEGAITALDALADFHEFEVQYYEKRDEEDCTPSYELFDSPGTGVHRFGWQSDKLPNIDQSVADPPAPGTAKRDAQPRNALLLLGAVLDYLNQREKPPSQAQVIDKICSRHPDVYGLKEAALEKWFAAANKALRDATSQKNPP